MKNCFLVIGLVLSCAYSKAQVELPCYKMRIPSSQYPLFSQAVFTGIYEKGGKLDYDVRVQKERTGLYVHLSICDREMANRVQVQLSQTIVEVLDQVNSINELDTKQQKLVDELKALNRKMKYALKSPARPALSIVGRMENDSRAYVLNTRHEGKVLLTTRTKGSLDSSLGKEVKVNGYRNEDGSVEVVNYLPLERNTLDIFIMSQCPFGLQAAGQIIEHINHLPDSERPHLNVHYIFYKTAGGFTSMHGRVEVEENLIQIVVRDHFSSRYHDYLLKRMEKQHVSWREIALEVGISKSEIAQISLLIREQENEIIDKEYNLVAGKYQIRDGSPTYLWEGEMISDPSLIQSFRSMEKELSGTCGE